MAAVSGKVALRDSTTAFSGACPAADTRKDLVGYGVTTCHEGTGPTPVTSNTTAALRKRAGCHDSDNNVVDFSVGNPVPRNSAAPLRSCTPVPAEIHEIQGSGLTSSLLDEYVLTSGVVIGVKTNGFFLQTPDGADDSDPSTSQGIFVFTSAQPAVVPGNLVSVGGTVGEFFGLTQLESSLPGDIGMPSAGTLPAPITLTTILDPNGTPTQLERFEGMRMQAASLTSVAPTNEFGETTTVITGVGRPIREPGISVLNEVPPDPTSGVPDCCIPRFDENPERVVIDSDGLARCSQHIGHVERHVHWYHRAARLHLRRVQDPA